MKRLLLLILFTAVFIAGGSNKKDTKTIDALKVQESITIDGLLDEAVWKKTPISGFIQKDPNEGQPSTEQTNMWIAYDDHYVYVAGMMYDSKPESIDRTLFRRDDSRPSDWVYLFFDTFKDNRSAYIFGINAAGSKNDGTMFNDGWEDYSWDGVWDVKTRICENGWCFEMRIPFSQLRFSNAEEMVWGINIKRQINKLNEHSYLVMVPKTESGFVSKFAELRGIRGIQQKQRIEALPYIVQKAQYLVHDPKDPFYKGNQYKTSIGGDLKVGLGSNLNLDVTFNPDFGQVEVDPASVNLSAFETYYQEKRPFFIEGSDVFGFGYGGANNNWGFNFGTPELFYSRRIGRSPQGWSQHEGYVDQPNETRILGAAKLTGKIGDVNLGFLSALTDKMHSTTDSMGVRLKDEVEPLTHYGVLRVQKQFNDGKQSLGMILTTVNRNLPDNYLSDRLSKQAYTFGFDGWTFLDEEQTYVITGSAVGSYTSGSQAYMQRLQKMPYRYYQSPDASPDYSFDPNRESISGWFTRIMLNKQKGNFYVNAALGAMSPGFEHNDLGSQWMANRINSHLVLGYRWYEPDGTFRRKNINLAYNINKEFDGNMLRNGLFMTGSVQFMNYYGLGFNASVNFESTSRTFTRGGPVVKMPGGMSAGFNFNTDSRKEFALFVYGGLSSDQDGSKYFDISTSIDWKPSSQLMISMGPGFSSGNEKHQWVSSFTDVKAVDTYGKRYVYADMKQTTISADIRVNWTFTPELSLQLYLQPYFSVGQYKDFNELKKSRTYDFAYYGKDNNSAVSYDKENETYEVDPDGNGEAAKFAFSNPDFNYKSFRANLVLRWEVLSGSVLYLVWTRDQADFQDAGNFRLGRDFKNLFSQEANNIFMAKFSYWLDI